ncbi:MAG: DUF4293 domain-containing protein [Paludibacteraceae bacterium]|nr:DUF4293 domain-containing protein [Paludibacteraceae bacterium]
MIQRVQTLYLLAIVALGIALCFQSVLSFVSPESAEVLRIWELSPIGLTELSETDCPPIALQGLWGLTLATALIPLLALIDIFLYRKRILQARLNIFLAMLCLGWYGVAYIYVWLMKAYMEDIVWSLDVWAAIPLVCFVLTLMATRRILKDEALVRAADRIR